MMWNITVPLGNILIRVACILNNRNLFGLKKTCQNGTAVTQGREEIYEKNNFNTEKSLFQNIKPTYCKESFGIVTYLCFSALGSRRTVNSTSSVIRM